MGEWIFDAHQTLLVLSSKLQKTKRCTTLSNLVYLAWKQVQFYQMNFPS
jgi:hypothetical protein